jgi:hypothetical protein
MQATLDKAVERYRREIFRHAANRDFEVLKHKGFLILLQALRQETLTRGEFPCAGSRHDRSLEARVPFNTSSLLLLSCELSSYCPAKDLLTL